MLAYQIEAGVPLASDNCKQPTTRFPLAGLRIGDSFSVPTRDELRKARDACATWQARHDGWRYTSRSFSDGTGQIWRTA